VAPLVGVTMSLHKLSAGRGYDYLIRQVAALDATHRGRTDLASYYTERGEAPGRWVGRGLAGIDGLDVGDVVTGEQMRLLFAEGRHPLAETLPGGGRVLALGVPYRPSTGEQPFLAALRARFTDHNAALGLPRRAALPAEVRARLRGEVAAKWFRQQEGRDPKGDLELASALARWSRPAPAAVGGYDLTFSPVKSVSTLWAIADPAVSAQIERAHHAAVAAALRFLEDHALYTREGTGGVRQVDVTGLVAAAFTHRDSRAGDPDLHTHVAVANKVQTLGGRWLSIDGRILHAAKVAASETYNTALEHHLTTFLGVRFADRPGGDRSKRPVREIVGIDPRLNQRWSARRQVIDVRKAELAAHFARDHGRPPGRVEMLQLAQQATLETRDRKHEPRTPAQQRTVWRTEAIDTLGGPERIDAMIDQVLNPAVMPMPAATPLWQARTADRVLDALEEHRATWQFWHLWAETQRRLRGAAIHPTNLREVAESVMAEAIARSVRLTSIDDPTDVPPDERRRDGASVFTVAGSTQHTSTRILAAEQRVMEAGALTDGQALQPTAVDIALAEKEATGTVLDAGQKQMVRTVATDRRRLQLVLAPAGAGKTTALKALADLWAAGGGHIVGLAPSAAAAAQLAEATGITADTLARLTWAIDHQRPIPDWADRIGPRTLLLIDEAGMADTPTLDTAIGHTLRHGGRVCLVGDDQQLGAIGAGGILTNLQHTYGAVRLTQLHRFTDPDEAAATLLVRAGDPAAVNFYTDRDRIKIADPSSLPDRLLAAWRHDQRQGLDSLMLASSRREVADLNRGARAARLAGQQPALEIDLADGNQASVGDLIITRRNDRHLTTGRDWVRNGDRWTVTGLTTSGGIRAIHRRTGRPVTLPGSYVREAVELGYATTIHTAQGVTADTTHSLVDELMTREQLYTTVSRGRTANHLYVAVGDGEPHRILLNHIQELTATDILQRVLIRTSLPVSATTVRTQHERAASTSGRVRARPASPAYDHRARAGRAPQAPAR
jgi:conjugative relaxase-like TrwC/TraI family protein